jgi:hypothetical protein
MRSCAQYRAVGWVGGKPVGVSDPLFDPTTWACGPVPEGMADVGPRVQGGAGAG